MARLARLVKSADFVAALGERSCARTEHFAVHHLPLPAAPVDPHLNSFVPGELSTKRGTTGEEAVDFFSGSPLFGVVVPKRHARRAVTRSLLKRTIYAQGEQHRDVLQPGVWVVRLRAPFDRARFASAASRALQRASREELTALFAKLARPPA